MPSHEFFNDSVKLSILEGGKVGFYYFSKEESKNYKYEDVSKIKRINNTDAKLKNTPDNLLDGVVKDLAKKVFIENRGSETTLKDSVEDTDFQYYDKEKDESSISDVEKLEKILNKYIDEENFEKELKSTDEIEGRKDCEEDQ